MVDDVFPVGEHKPAVLPEHIHFIRFRKPDRPSCCRRPFLLQFPVTLAVFPLQLADIHVYGVDDPLNDME